MNPLGYQTTALALCMWLLPHGAAYAQEERSAPPIGMPPAMNKEPIRAPAVAGTFYPADATQLRATLNAFLAQAEGRKTQGRIRALVVPHAGYVYSGAVAAHAFKQIIGAQYQTVVLIGNSHHEGYLGAAIYSKGRFKTPLGEVSIDADFSQRLLAANPQILDRQSPHIEEHSLEVELPFLQTVLGDFQIVPILLGTQNTDLARALAKTLRETADEDTLVIASSDLSHYPAYDDAKFADLKTVEAVTSGKVEQLERTLRQMEQTRIPELATLMCGEGAVKTVMFYAQHIGADQIEHLNYANSGDITGSSNRVVGYAAIAFSSNQTAKKEPQKMNDENLVTIEQQTTLLTLARNTIKTYLQTGKTLAFTNADPVLEQPLGAFVTLHKQKQLRGCIGRFESDQPLYRVVQDMAVAAATQDGRFSPVTAPELAGLQIEISVLSPLRKGTWQEIELGKHGVQVVSGLRCGVFLPQVATETGWDLDTFMGQLCAQKAGLLPEAWKDPKTDVYLFTAQVFHEE